MFLQHITHIIGRRPLYLPPFMIFFAGAASKMSHQALCHMNKPWTPIPAARASRVHHTRVAVHTLSENKVTTTAKRFWSDGFIFKFSVHLHLKRRRPRGLFQRRRLSCSTVSSNDFFSEPTDISLRSNVTRLLSFTALAHRG